MIDNELPVLKDRENERPIPTIWRSIFIDIVNAFVKKDYALVSGIEGVLPLTKATIHHIEKYIEDYGEELVHLPDATWESSIYIWMGTHWDVLVDLWTAGEGRSDLVLSAQVLESDGDYVVSVNMVHVP